MWVTGGVWLRVALAFGFFATSMLLVLSEDLGKTEGPGSYRSVKAPLHLLGECRRHLTFLASMALGAFVTRVMKDSPLTPLPLPPLSDSLKWNLVTLPAHIVAPFYQWAQRHPKAQSTYLNQGFGGLVEHRGSGRSLEKNDEVSVNLRNKLTRLLRHVPRTEASENSVIDAVHRTLKPLKFILPHAIGMKHWLLRWC